MIPAKNDATLCGSIVEICDNGLAKNIKVIKIGGILQNYNNH